MGRALAVKVRTEGYNAMLAKAKQGMEFKNEKNNVWVLRAADEFASSSTEKTAFKARIYLQRTRDEHPGTPWAMLAERELAAPLGWEWRESYTFMRPADPRANNSPQPPRARREPTAPRRPPRRNPPPL